MTQPKQPCGINFMRFYYIVKWVIHKKSGIKISEASDLILRVESG